MNPQNKGSPPIAAAGFQGNDDATSDFNTRLESYPGDVPDSRSTVIERLRKDERAAGRKAPLAADVLHPPGRVMALRRHGHAITLEWVNQRTAVVGRLHRVGRHLMSGG